jgi:hypothetical protein
VFFLVREAFGETVAAGDRANQPLLFQQRPVFGANQFDGSHAQFRSVVDQFGDGHRSEAPVDHGLVNAITPDFEESRRGLAANGTRATGRKRPWRDGFQGFASGPAGGFHGRFG